jgi:NAD(P)-dependent dehydrogenase (short-subunit alcohol dehydrogenase family)
MGKVVFITGASKGIGLETAKLLAEKGYKVYGGARSDFNAKGVTSVKLDVTDTDSVANAVKYITDKEGGIDILINNAGMGISDAIENTPEEQSKYIFEVNFFGPFRLIKHCLPYLRKSGGKIINISSVAAALCIPFQAFYSCSKAALDALAFALIPEVKPFGITVTNVLPGDTKTSFTAARQKSYSDNDAVYGERIKKSIQVMEKDEQNGMPAIKVSDVILRCINKKSPPVYVAVGFKYKLFMLLNKILPKKFVIYVIGKLYGG